MKECRNRVSEVEAKARPFCGGKAMISHVTMLGNSYYHKFTVFCEACHARTVNRDSKEEAIKAWNTRYEPPFNGSVPAGNERLKK